MKYLHIILVLIILQLGTLPRVYGNSVELTFAGNAERYDSGDLDYGLSSRVRYAHYAPTGAKSSLSHGPFLQISFPGTAIYQFDGIVGWGGRYGRDVFCEFAGGIRYSTIYGGGVAVITGAGYKFAKNWLISIPITYRIGFSTEYAPYVGYEF